jgi:preprotein translocase subunit SecA
LRGRSGRQGDPGSTQFFISMEDELLRLFGGERMQSIVARLGVDEDQPIEAGMLSRSIENAQKKVEGRNFSTRKYVLQYDNVMNKQREIIYGDRRRVLVGEDMKDRILAMCEQLVDEAVDNAVMGSKFPEDWDFENLGHAIRDLCRSFPGLKYSVEETHDLAPEILKEDIYNKLNEIYEAKESEISSPIMRDLERMVLLRVIDNKWMDHIDAMDQLRSGIGLRAIGQQDPATAYAQEGFDMFELMTQSIKEDTVTFCFNATVQTKTERKQVISGGKEVKDDDVGHYLGESAAGLLGGDGPEETEVPEREQHQETVRRDGEKIGRNDPCPCGSGKKYKNCCGKNV